MANIKEQKVTTKSDPSILLKGTATPYLAIFSEEGMPIMNQITGIPLGAYISRFQFKYSEEEENLATLTFECGNPDIVDQDDLSENKTIILQWGYIYADGTAVCNKPKAVKIQDFNCTFDDSGTHASILCRESTADIRYALPLKAGGFESEKMSNFLDNGCELDIGVVIEKFE